MNHSGSPPSKRMRLSGDELTKISKEGIIDLYVKQQEIIEELRAKLSDADKDGDEKCKTQLAETGRRENVLVMRLATKEQELQQYAAQIAHVKKSQEDASSKSLREAMLDPAVNLLFSKMRDELKETKDKLEQAQSELSAWKFTPDSQTGKKLMSRCRTLIAENQELGRQLSQGKVAQLEAELALQKKYSEELKESQEELNEFVIQLDEEVEGMQSTIQMLQQQLMDARKEAEMYKNMAEARDYETKSRTKEQRNEIRTKLEAQVRTKKEFGEMASKGTNNKVGENEGAVGRENGHDSPNERNFEGSEFVCKEECKSDGDENTGENRTPMEVDDVKYETAMDEKGGDETPTYSEHEIIDESRDSSAEQTPERAFSDNGDAEGGDGEGLEPGPTSAGSGTQDECPINEETYAIIDNGSDDETEHVAQIVSTHDEPEIAADKAPGFLTEYNDISDQEEYENSEPIPEQTEIPERTPSPVEAETLENRHPPAAEELNTETYRDDIREIQQRPSTPPSEPVNAETEVSHAVDETNDVEPQAPTTPLGDENASALDEQAAVPVYETDEAGHVGQLAEQKAVAESMARPSPTPLQPVMQVPHPLMQHPHVPVMGDPATAAYLMNPHFQQLPNTSLAQQQALMAEQASLMYKTLLAQQQQQQQQMAMAADEKNAQLPDGGVARTGEELRAINPLMHGVPFTDPSAAFLAQYKAMLATQQMFLPGPDGKTPQMLAPGGLGLYPGVPLVQPAMLAPQQTADAVTNGVTSTWASSTNVTYTPHPLMHQGFLGAAPPGMMMYPGQHLTTHALATPAVVDADKHHGSGDHGPLQNGLPPPQKTAETPEAKDDAHAVA